MLTLLLLTSSPTLAAPCGTPDGTCSDLAAVVASVEATPPVPVKKAVTPEVHSHRPKDKKKAKVYDANAKRAEQPGWNLTKAQKGDLEKFYENWVKNRARYQAVADKTGIPAELIAALHWRESTGDFGTYLHQGDPLGKKAVHVPRNIPIFHKWEKGAVHALDQKKWLAKDLAIDKNTTDLAALATYAEYYNGLGYSYKKKPSPYVWSGTDKYSKGKYIADGVYSSTVKDRQLGVVAMIQYIRGMEGVPPEQCGDAPELPPGMGDTTQGDGTILKKGDTGQSVTRLQEGLKRAGFLEGPADGNYGRGTRAAVRALQKSEGLRRDGVAGPDTWNALQRNRVR